MINLEKMKNIDSEEVWQLQKQCFSVPWSKESVEEMFQVEGYKNFVAKKNGHIAGYIGMKAVLDEADITNVAVSPVLRRQGIGTGLLNCLLEEAGKDGIARIFLEVRVSNKAAVHLYKQAGFRITATRKNYYDKPKEDAYVMVWEA